MKKLLILLLVTAFTLTAVNIAFAKVDTEVGDWTIEGENAIVFTCGGNEYAHTLTNGFPGSGTYDADDSYTWEMTGAIDGSTITFNILYTGSNAGYTLNGEGTINPDGAINGTIDGGGCQEFTMTTGTATQETYKNHGQYVRSQENKKGAAHSRPGMPTQSKGHTK